jgi:hypothetical protein
MAQAPERYDLTGYSFEEFVAFVFEHEVADGAAYEEPWYFWPKIEIEFDPGEVCRHYVRLFGEPEFLRDAYSAPQLEQGFWAILCGFDCSISDLLGRQELPFSATEQCIRSMFDLFSRLFVFEPLDSAVYMWWDPICDAWRVAGENSLLQDVMFDTLSRILLLPAEHCRKAALHGLGHLHHPQTAERIAHYLKDNPTLDEATKNYALAAASFKIL